MSELSELLQEDLAVSIAQVRGGQGTGAMADELLRRDKRTHQLVGVVEYAGKAVFYEPGRWSLVTVPFDETGIDGLKRRRWERLKERTSVERFVREHDESFWSWVHPGYRLVFDLGPRD